MEGRWANSCCPHQACPKETGQGGSVSAPLFSALSSREDSIRITPLQLFLAPHQAWTHSMSTYQPPHQDVTTPTVPATHTGEKDLYTFLRYFPSCGSSFYRRLFLAQQNSLRSSLLRSMWEILFMVSVIFFQLCGSLLGPPHKAQETDNVKLLPKITTARTYGPGSSGRSKTELLVILKVVRGKLIIRLSKAGEHAAVPMGNRRLRKQRKRGIYFFLFVYLFVFRGKKDTFFLPVCSVRQITLHQDMHRKRNPYSVCYTVHTGI